MNKKLHKLTSLITATFMMLEFMAPGLASALSEEEAQTQKRADYKIYNLDENNEENGGQYPFYMDENSNLTYITPVKENIEKELNKDPRSIKLALETTEEITDIKLVVRKDLEIYDANHFEDKTEATKAFTETENKYKKQGLIPDISLIQEGNYKIENNFQIKSYTNDMRLKEDFGENYKIYHFKVDENFDFEKNGLGKKQNDPSKERIYIFNFKIRESIDQNINMLEYVKDGDGNVDYKNQIQVKHQGDLIAAILNDKSFTKYKTDDIEKEKQQRQNIREKNQKRKIEKEKAQAEKKKQEEEKQRAEEEKIKSEEEKEAQRKQEEKKKAEAEKKSLEKKAEEEKTLERKKSEQNKKQEEKLQSQENKKLEEVKKSEEKLQQTENKKQAENRADKTEKHTIKLVSTGKLTLKPDEELDLNSLVFSIKEGKQNKIFNYKDIEKDTKIDREDFDKKRDNFNKEIEKNKIKEPVQTRLKITYKDYDSINIPITLVTKETKIDQINKNENIDISTWGLKLNDKSIYTVTLDVKSLSDIKEIKLNFLNALDKKDKDIKIDRIVKTDGISEEDITLTDPIYRDRENIKDYKDLPQEQIKEKLEKLEIKNPVNLSKNLEAGHKYVFFIEKKEKSADEESKLLLEIEAKTQDEKTIRKEIEIEANDPDINQKLNNFRTIGQSSTQNTYNTKTDEKQTTVGDNYGVYKVDVDDFHFGYNFDYANRVGRGWLSSGMKVYIRVPKDVTEGQKFTVNLPKDFSIDYPLNSTVPIVTVNEKGDKTTPLIQAYYKSDSEEPELLDLNHYLEFEVTKAGADLINKNGIDYEGVFSLANKASAAVLDGVGYYTQGYPDWNKKFTYSSGISAIASHWRPESENNTSITKTFTFESKYGDKTTELKDQATLSYGNEKLEGSPEGVKYFKNYNLIAYTKDINNFFFLRYYKDGAKYAKSGYVLNANRTEKWDSTTDFKDNTGSMTSKIFVADSGGDKKVGSFKGELREIYPKEQGITFGTRFTQNQWLKNKKLTKIKTKKTVYVEQTVKIPSDKKDNLIVINMTNPKKDSYRSDADITFTGEIEPTKLYTFVKVVKADLDGKGVKEYAVSSDTAKFELHQKVDNEYKKIKENIETDKDSGSFKLRFPQKNAYYKLVETKRPEGFQENNKGFEFYVDKDGIVKQSEKGKVLVNENGYIPVENKLENPHNKLTIKKVDQYKKPLAGAVFAISNKENGRITYKTSGKDGKVLLRAKEFKKGHYTIKEIKAPDGYEATPDTKDFWVDEHGNYFEKEPNNFSTRTNRQALLNNSSDKSDGNIFDILNKKISLVFSSNKVYAEEGNLPFEEEEKNYNNEVKYDAQTGGKGAQTIKTHAPILIEAIEPTFKQTFYLNPNKQAPTTSNSNTVFTIFGKELNNSGEPKNTQSATLLKNSKVSIYKLNSGNLPDNPKDFDANASNVTKVDNLPSQYVPSNDTYQINFGGEFNDSSKPTYIVVLDGRAENTDTNVYVGARLINTKGDVEFPVIKFPNSGAAVSSSATRGHGSINLEKYDILGRPAQGATFELINNLTGVKESFILKNDNPGHVQNTYYLEKGIRPGKYTIVETKAPTANGMTFTLADNISDRSWQLTVDDKNKNGKFEYVISADNNLAYNREDDPRNIRIENIPSFKPLNLTINLFEQDGKTQLNGGLFTIEKEGENPKNLSVNNNSHKIEIKEPGEYILKQKTVPKDFENKEKTWKLNVFVNTTTGNLEVEIKDPYNYLKYKDQSTLDVLNKKETSTNLELPPPYGDVSKTKSEDFEFEIENKRNFRFTIKKVDLKYSTALNGAVFELKDTNGISKTATTNGLGLATFEELEPGTYTLSEKTPPKNYKKNDKTSTITIAEDGSITWSGDLIKTKQETKYKDKTTISFVEPFKTNTVHQRHKYYPSYMNYKSYADIKDPQSGKVEFYLMLQSDNNNTGSYTDKDTKVNFFGDNLEIKTLRLYDVFPENKPSLNKMMGDRNADNYNVNEINISSGSDNHGNPIELKSNIRDITNDKGDLNYKNIEKQLVIPSARFGGNQSNWSFLVKVEAEVIDKTKESSLNYHWWTKENSTSEASIRNYVNIKALEKTESSKEKILDYNPTLEVENEKEDIKFGKFTINKTDEDGKALKEATFKLSKKTNYGSSLLDKKYQVEGNFETLIKNTEDGNVTFDNLPPGTYDLEETKSPDGYIKDKRKFVVVVQKDGKTYVVDATTYKPESYPLEGDIQKPNIDIDESKARTSPIKLDGRIEVTGYKMFTKTKNYYGNMVESQSSNVDASVQALWMKANLEFPEDTIVGDTFTIVLDENLDMRGVSLEDKTQKPFVDEKGNELAKHINTSQVDGKYVFTYKITKKPENADQLILSLERPVYVNRNKIWNNQVDNISFTNTIAGSVQGPSQEFSIIYNSFKSPNNYGYEIGNEPYIYPSSNKVDVYIQATSHGNDTLRLSDSNLDYSNAEVTISRGNDYGYIGESKERPASFGTEIMDFSHVVESEKITKNNGYVEILLPGKNYNLQKYNIKVIGARKIDTNKGISSTSAIYSNSYYYYNNPVVSYIKSLAPIKGESKGKYIKTPKITVKKTDETGNIFLPGAEFKLESQDNNYSQTRTTNSRGELLFTGIKQSGSYTLTETKTPEGYKKLNNKGLSIYVDYIPGTAYDGSLDDVSIRSIDNSQNASVDGNTITVKNKKGPYTPPEVKFANYPNHIQFTKVDEKNQPLKGAKFKLILDKDDKEVANSEREGSLISYEKLAPGKYQVRETDQPKGYLTPKEKNNTVATFTVKDDGTITDVNTYSLEGKLVESNGDHKIYNMPEDGKGKFTIYKKAYKKASGKDKGAKIALKGAEFTLSKMQKEKGNPEDLPKTFNDLVKTVEREDGSLKFDSLDPGVYELKETKSPDGYVKSEEVYVVVVAKSGKTTIVPESAYTPESFPVDDIKIDPDKETTPNTRTQVKNLDDEIKVSNYYFDQKDNPGTVKHHKAQAITMRYTINLPRDIIPGDFFTIDLDDKLDLNGLELTEEKFDDLTNEYGEVIAKASKNSSGKNSYTFTLTDYVKGKTNITVSGEDNFFVDPNVVITSGNQTFTNKLGKQSGSRELYVDYNPYFANGSDNHGVYYDSYGRAISQYYNNYISAKHYINRETGKTEIYYYVYGYNNMPNNYNFDLTNYTSDGKKGSIYFDTSTEVEVYKVDNPFIQNLYGNSVINQNKIIPSLGDKVVLEANKTPISNRPTLLEQQGYNSGRYNRLKFYLGEQKGVFGYLIKVTTSFDQNSSKPLVIEGEIKLNYSYKARNNYGYISDFYGNSSLDYKLWIEQYGSSRQGDADKLLNIKLTKQELLDGKAEGKFIPGAGFRLQSRDGYTAYKKTNDQGVLTFENVPEGTYALTETFTPQGYAHPVSAWIVHVRYDNNENKSKIFIDEVNNQIQKLSDNELKVYNSKEEIIYPTMEYLNIPNRIEFTKVDYKDSPLQNVSFELRKKQENSTVTKVQEAESGEDGKFAFEKIAPGEYEVWETKASEGYKTPDKAVATFTVDKDGKIINLQIDGKAVQEGSVNKIVNKKLGKIDFIKVKANEGVSLDDKFIPNDKNSSPLQGAVFELQKLSQSDDGTSQYTKIKEVKDYTDGKISFSDLEEGSYKLIETKAPDGYKKPSYDVATFDIKADGEVANLTVNGKDVKLKNDKEVASKDEVEKEHETNKIEMTSPYRILNTKEAKLKIVKKDIDGKTLLGGAEFELYRFKPGQNSQTGQDRSAEGTEIPETLNPNNLKFNGSLEKYSKETKDGKDIITWVLSNTVANDNTKIKTSSDEKDKGTATISGLSDGIYWLKEIKAPVGYLAHGAYIGPIIIKNGKVTVPKDKKEPLTLKIENENSENSVNVATVTNRKPVYPSTGGLGTFVYSLIGILVMVIGLVAYLMGLRKKREQVL